MTEVENVVRTTFGNYEKMMQDFSKTSIQDFWYVRADGKTGSKPIPSYGRCHGILTEEHGEYVFGINEADRRHGIFFMTCHRRMLQGIYRLFSQERQSLLRKYGLDLTQATLKEWALKQGLDADISSMTQAQKAMLRYQYVMQNTAAAQGDFARTADTWHNQITVLTQSFQQLASIIGGALINAFKPFVRTLNQVMVYVIAFAETVTNALGSIFGWQYEVSAGGVAEDWADGMEDFRMLLVMRQRTLKTEK